MRHVPLLLILLSTSLVACPDPIPDTGATPTPTPAVCGDGEVNGDEECDDGNTTAGDGCDADCLVECLDRDGDGHSDSACGGTDCDDGDPAVSPDAAELCNNGVDDDCDDGTSDLFDNDEDGSNCLDDCDDDDPALSPNLPEICNDGLDNDCNPFSPDVFDADNDGDGCDTDCDDADSTVGPSRPEVCDDGIDNDCDPGTIDAFDGDGDGDDCRTDCDDDDPNRAGTLAEQVCDGIDNDCDPATIDEPDADGDGFTPCNGDCDDANPDAHVAAPELCDNGIEDDCNPATPDIFDDDGDGDDCRTDCDDADPAVGPSAVETTCDSIDNDCDPATPDDPDSDGDGFGICAGGLDPADCDDTDAAVFPGAAETCDGIDDDCDGSVDEGFDGDADGVTSCGPDGTAGSADDDCNDGDPTVFPGAQEVCDGIDNNCNGSTADEGQDADADGVNTCTDCDDTDPNVFPGAPERCNGVDDDCDGSVPAQEQDGDSDGFRPCDGDCDDTNRNVNPNEAEVCADLIDNDCDPGTADLFDGDGDGETCDSDCDDTDPGLFTGNPEVCDGRDQNCDGVADEGFDLDGDLVSSCGADGVAGTADDDCDDADPGNFPGNTELCADLSDNDCDADADCADGDCVSDPVCAVCDLDGIWEPVQSEVCDDGNSCNYDGCAADSCDRTATVVLADVLTVRTSASPNRGFDLDNADGDDNLYTGVDNLIGSSGLVADSFDSSLEDALSSGAMRLAMTFEGLDSLTDDPELEVAMHSFLSPYFDTEPAGSSDEGSCCNGIDDDGDGAVDLADGDCGFQPWEFDPAVDPPWRASPPDQVYSDLNEFPACVPDILVTDADNPSNGLYGATTDPAQPPAPWMGLETPVITFRTAGGPIDFVRPRLEATAVNDGTYVTGLQNGLMGGVLTAEALWSMGGNALCPTALHVVLGLIDQPDQEAEGSVPAELDSFNASTPIFSCIFSAVTIDSCLDAETGAVIPNSDLNGDGAVSDGECVLDPRIGDGFSSAFDFSAVELHVVEQRDSSLTCP